MRILLRLPLLIGLILAGLICALLIRVAGAHRVSPQQVGIWWSKKLLRIFSIEAHFHGKRGENPQLQVANHVSWLDMFVLATRGHHRYVAKSEVAHWPIAGTLAKAMGTVFIRRGKGGAGPVLVQATPLLQAGGCFLFFPEGTTTDGRQVKNFHARLFQAAVDAECPVQPIAIRYSAAADLLNPAPFIGDDTLVGHIWGLLTHPGFRVDVSYCQPIASSKPIGVLASASQRAIELAMLNHIFTDRPTHHSVVLT